MLLYSAHDEFEVNELALYIIVIYIYIYHVFSYI